MSHLSKICYAGSRLFIKLTIRKRIVHLVRCAGSWSGKYLAFGNPILDSVVKLKNKDIINRFKLQEDGHRQTDADEMQRILREVEQQKYTWSNVPGGSALNTMRLLQWLVGDSPSTVIFGAVGKDVNGSLLVQMVEKFKVKTQFEYIERFPTAWVFSLAHRDNRSLIASIGAAEMYSIDHFDKPQNIDLLKQSNIVYMEAFFITRRKEISRHILSQCQTHNKPFAFNLNAEYLVQEYTDDMLHFVQSCTVLFGNYDEFVVTARAMKLSIDELVKKLLAAKDDKLIVITDGAKPINAYSKGEAQKFEVPVMTDQEIVDATGCGDAFVAGYIYGKLSGESMLTCIKWGNWMAQKILKQIGCVPPSDVKPDHIKTIK